MPQSQAGMLHCDEAVDGHLIIPILAYAALQHMSWGPIWPWSRTRLMVAMKKPRNGRAKVPTAARAPRQHSARVESPDVAPPAPSPSPEPAPTLKPVPILEPARAGTGTDAPPTAFAGFTPAGIDAAGIDAAGIDAAVRAGVALADGVQAFGRALLEMQRHSVTAGLAAARSLIDARNLDDVVAVQRRYINGRVEQVIRESGSLADLARRVAGEALAPLVTGAAEKAKPRQ
jgi:hypothetical protein